MMKKNDEAEAYQPSEMDLEMARYFERQQDEIDAVLIGIQEHEALTGHVNRDTCVQCRAWNQKLQKARYYGD
jgi:hypothetical protein